MQIPISFGLARKIVGATAAAILLLLVAAFAFPPRRDLLTTIDIASPPSRVWAVLADTAAYPQWNPHMRLVGRLVQGDVIEHVEIDDNDRIVFRPRLLVVRPDRELRWFGRIILPGLLDAEHYFLLRPVGGSTLMTQGEHLSGVALWIFDTGRLRSHFDEMNAALKTRAEQPPAEAAGTPR